uniref:Uncharacterized protein n=1 Tax=Arundo donax TaxID=35708 RepID=A0A0A8YPE7_ARUDO
MDGFGTRAPSAPLTIGGRRRFSISGKVGAEHNDLLDILDARR